MDIKKHDYTILVVENNQFNLELLLLILNQHEYRLLAAGNGKKTLAICEEITPDLILLDVQMPDMDGFEVAAKLQENERTQHIPILFTSTFSDSINILRCFESGGVDYINKPFKKKELLARINTHLSIKRLREELQIDRNNLSAILRNMLPEELLNTLKNGSFPKPELKDQVAVIFTDFKNFSQLSQKIGSRKSVDYLNIMYFVFDEIIENFGLERIKTIGDAYFAVGGINTIPDDLYLCPILAGLKMQDFIRYYNSTLDDIHWQLRIGYTVGPVTSGVIGYQKIAYDVWGDTVNLANKLEQEAKSGEVAVTEPVFKKIKKYITTSGNTIVESPIWGMLRIYHCDGVKETLPGEQLKKIQSIDPEKLLEQASNKKSLLNKIFRLPVRQG